MLAAAGAALGLAYFVAAPLRYHSSVKLLITRQSSGYVGAQPPMPASLASQAEVIRSTAVLAVAAGSPALQAMPTVAGADDPVEALRDGLRVEFTREAGVLAVGYVASKPRDARVGATEITNAYIAFSAKKTRSSASDRIEDLAAEKARWQADLAKKTQAMEDYRRSAGQAGGAPEIELRRRIQALSGSLTDAHMATIETRGRYEEALRPLRSRPNQLAALEAMRRQGLVGGDEARQASIRTELATLEESLRDLRRRRYLEEHPMVQRVRARMDQLELSRAAMLEATFESAQHREQELQKSLNELQRAELERSGHSAELRRIETDVQRTQRLCEAYDAQILELKSLAGSDPGSIAATVVSAATEPSAPQSPRLAPSLWIGLGAGLLAGLIAGLLDGRLRSMSELVTALRLPILASIPRSRSLRASRTAEPGAMLIGACAPIDTALGFLYAKGACKSLLVTSASDGDGKTTVAAGLAVAIARAGKKVLLVDADYRHPSLGAMLGCGGDRGLSQVLSGQESSDGVIVRTRTEGLDFLDSGPRPPNPADLLNSQALADVLLILTDRYDRVVVDAPSVLALPDARILGAMVDATVLVARVSKATRGAMVRSRDALLSVGARIAGLVINDARGVGDSLGAPRPAARATARRTPPPPPAPPPPPSEVAASDRRQVAQRV